MREGLPKPPEPYRGYWRSEITLYRGDEIIDFGTIQEVAERKKCLKSTIYWYTTPAAHRRAAKRKDQSKSIRAVIN